MKKSLLTILMAGATFVSQAITPQELDGKTVMQVFFGNDYQGFGPVLATAGKFRYDNAANQLYLDGFRGRLNIPLEWDQNGQYFYLPLKTTYKSPNPGNGFSSAVMDVVMRYTTPVQYVYTWTSLNNVYGRYAQGTLTQVGSTYNQYPATCYRNDDFAAYTKVRTNAFVNDKSWLNGLDVPSFTLDLEGAGQAALVMISASHDNAKLNTKLVANNQKVAVYSKITFQLMDEINAHATDSEGQSYDMFVYFCEDENDQPSDSRVKLCNLYNQGLRYRMLNDYTDYSFDWIKGDIDRENGTFIVEPDFTGGMIAPTAKEYDTKHSGTFTQICNYLYNGNYVYLQSSLVDWTGYWYTDEEEYYCDQVLASDMIPNNDGTADFPEITGKFTVAKAYHETPTLQHQWAHTADGQLHTYEDWDLDIDRSRFYNHAAGPNYTMGLEFEYEWTKVKVDKIDVTHSCAIDETSLQFGYGTIAADNSDKYLYIGGEVKQLLHNHHLDDIDYYEYYVVPGLYSKPEGNAFNCEKGHVNGLNVTEYVTDFQPGQGKNGLVRKANDLNEGNSFNLLIPEKAFTENDITPSNGQYTLYVKANYKTEGLEPTFHALTPLTRRTTGVNDLVLDLEPASIEVVNGNIVIEGSNGTAMVSTLSGVVIYQGDDATVAVAPGTYIVRAGGTVKKLLVK